MKVKKKWLCRDVHHHDILDEDILHDTATTTAALETETDISSEETAVCHLYVLDTAGHLTADNKSAMTMEYDTVVHDKILARSCSSATVLILS